MKQTHEGVLTPNQTTTYLQYMSSFYTETQMEGLSNVHLLQLNTVDMPLGDWCASAAHIAAQLSAIIEAVLPE